MKRDKELKKEIVNWLFANENVFNRYNCCVNAFRAYIYDANGNYLIGGQETAEFIEKAEKLLFD